MKIIKSFCLVSIGLCATVLLHAQDIKNIKAEIAKPAESTVPPPGSKPAATPDLISQPKMIELRKSENAVQETPSPYNKVKSNDKDPATSLSAENAKILAGKGERPKQTTPMAASDAQNVKPPILLAPVPVVLKQENQ